MAGYEDEASSKSDSEFRRTFKKYRDLASLNSTELIDFDRPDDYDRVQRYSISTSDVSESDLDSVHLRPQHEWRAYEIKGKPGFLFLKNPFTTPDGHSYWARRCLLDYARRPNVTNVDGMMDRKNSEKDESILDDTKFLKKLRWATLGYHHNWNTKVYDDSNRSDVPEDLRRLSSIVAKALFGPESKFDAEAVIVNFYKTNSTLAGHTDHSERNYESPLLSFSFGQSAVFLLGGRTLDEKPTAVKIRSGDVVAMSGECRLAYHGVPRIFRDDRFDQIDSDGLMIRIIRYLNENRINLNVRQVN